MKGLSIILPAHNEAGYLPACVQALVASDNIGCDVEVIVAANGCSDSTVAVAEAQRSSVEAQGWAMNVLNIPQGSKPNALNAGDAVAGFDARIYLDVDVLVSPDLLPQIARVLNCAEPIYASGIVNVTAEKSAFSRAYARFYRRMPFFTSGVPGCGLFAVNASGRAKWEDFPAIISDDTFVRLQFTPAERKLVKAVYDWPVVDGFGALVKVRRRQDRGVAEIRQLYPGLEARDDQRPSRVLAALAAAVRHPFGAMAYVLVALAVRILPDNSDGNWSRGR